MGQRIRGPDRHVQDILHGLFDVGIGQPDRGHAKERAGHRAQRAQPGAAEQSRQPGADQGRGAGGLDRQRRLAQLFGPRRSIGMVSRIVPGKYEVLAEHKVATQAREILRSAGLIGPAPYAAPPESSDPPR